LPERSLLAWMVPLLFSHRHTKTEISYSLKHRHVAS